MLTLQQIFDKALLGVRAQGAASTTVSGCVYRDGAGRKCAVGQLIDDWLYTREFDGPFGGGMMSMLADRDRPVPRAFFAALEKSGVPTDETTTQFLRQLQLAHDHAANPNQLSFPERFEADMRGVAKAYNLEYKAP